MRKSEANSLVHDLLNLENWQNPLDKQMVEGNVQINLLTKEITGTDDDWIIEFFRKKIDWFQERVKKLDGLKDFQKAEIKLVGNKEKVELIFKNETLSGEVFWGQYLTEMKERFEKSKNKKNEKEYVDDLIQELKNFSKLKQEEREAAANNLNDNWWIAKEYAPLSKKVTDITSTLLVLHHYSEDPKGHDKMIQEILHDLENLRKTKWKD